MTITELKDRFRKLGCNVRWNNGTLHVIKNIPFNIVDIDNSSIMYFNNKNINKDQSLKIKALCGKYYDERNGR